MLINKAYDYWAVENVVYLFAIELLITNRKISKFNRSRFNEL
jgi:hypothetical protein